jgi:DNA-binding MarR family transcriptional regulator
VAATRWLTDDEQRAWRSYLEATTLLFDALDRRLQRDAAIPHGYYEILVRLSEAENRTIRMSDLADRTRSSRSRLSHAVARLEERGWVERRNCPTDKRGQLAVLTDGSRVGAAAPDHVSAVRQYVIDPLTPEQISQLDEIGQAIVASLEADPP